MLPKKHRVPVQKFPRKARTSYNGKRFVVKSSPNKLSYSRVGFIIAKGVAARAVDRNKTKRMLAEAFRKNEKILKTPGLDHLVIINPSDKLDDTNLAELNKETNAALSRLEK